jgi:hypothetical protein
MESMIIVIGHTLNKKLIGKFQKVTIKEIDRLVNKK